jgi:hypothetical protein
VRRESRTVAAGAALTAMRVSWRAQRGVRALVRGGGRHRAAASPRSGTGGSCRARCAGPGRKGASPLCHPEPESRSRRVTQRNLAARVSQLDEEVLSDLSYAFMAIDLDHSGTLEPEEVRHLLRVLGGDNTIELEQCRAIMTEAKVSRAFGAQRLAVRPLMHRAGV